MAAVAAAGPLMTALSVASTAFAVVSQIQQGNIAEEQAKAQQQAYEMQAHNAQVVAERNALIAEDQAKYAAARDREQAGQEEAASQRAAKIKRKETELKISSARATAGASGAGAYDPTVLDEIGNIAGAGEFDALTAMYEGKSASSLLRSQAALTEYQGKTQADMIRYGGATDASLLTYQGQNAAYGGAVAKQQAYSNAIGTAIGGASDAYEISQKYSPKKAGDG